jgi:hypothetical protein
MAGLQRDCIGAACCCKQHLRPQATLAHATVTASDTPTPKSPPLPPPRRPPQLVAKKRLTDEDAGDLARIRRVLCIPQDAANEVRRRARARGELNLPPSSPREGRT